MFKDSAIIFDAIRQSFLTKSATAAMFISVLVDFGRPPSPRHLLPAPFLLEIENVRSVNSLIPISLLAPILVFLLQTDWLLNRLLW
jgi:hypothetical protein